MFNDYAKYNDLRDLHMKVVPPVARMEDRLSEFHTEQIKLRMMVSRFDEVILNKVNKETLTQYRQTVADTYTKKVETNEIVKKHETLLENLQNRTETLQEMIAFQSKSIQQGLNTSIRKVVQ